MATRTTKSKSTTAPSRTTKTSATTKSKSSTKTATEQAAPKMASAAPVVVDAPTPVVAGPMMKKKELVDAVVKRSGLKKKDVKPTVEATLVVLGEALREGRELNLQPMGKFKLNREKKLSSGHMFVARIRQSDRATNAMAEKVPAETSKSDDDAD